MNYILSRKAEEDVISIYLHGFETHGHTQADLYHARIEKGLRFLAENPYAAEERPELDPSVRIHPIGVHIIIYTITKDQNVFIIRIRHQREDWKDH